MQSSNSIDQQFYQLREALQIPVVQLDTDNHSATLLDAKNVLNSSAHCCIVVATSISRNKFQNIKNLHRSMTLLKHLQRQLCIEYPILRVRLIGIYPSLDYPACVYELKTDAERYVTRNVLPHGGSPLKSTIKYLISKLLGANPSVGGLGLTLYKE